MIETARLLLRPFCLQDSEALVSELNNFNITRNTARIPKPYHHQDALDFLNFANSLNAQSLGLAITFPSAPEKLIGGISYLYSAEKNDAELGYWLSESQWGKGLMTEAAVTVVHHAFTVSNIEKLVACYHNDNPASARILKKLGFEEGVQCRNFSLAQGKEVRVTNMNLTRNTWQTQQKSRGA
jgi:RimJ/RimL family protein N-acetyltransferase